MRHAHLWIHPWLLTAWLAVLVHAGAVPAVGTRWKSSDGRSFEGIYLGSAPANGKALFAGPAGTRLVVDPAQLSAADRARLEALAGSETVARLAALAAPFRPSPTPDRNRLPLLNQGEFGKHTNNCFPNAMAAFLLWWDQQGVLAVPQRGDPHAKAAWLHERLTEYCATTATDGTNTRNAERGLNTYFQNHLAGTATVRINTDFDFSPANLSRYPVGIAACLLNLTLYDGETKQGGHYAALVSANPDGTLVFRTWGIDFHGKLRDLDAQPATPANGTRSTPANRREIDLTNTAQLPKWFRQLHLRFILDPAEWNGVTVVVPYIYQKSPGSAPAPPDPLFPAITPTPRRERHNP